MTEGCGGDDQRTQVGDRASRRPVLSGEGPAANTYLFDGVWRGDVNNNNYGELDDLEEREALDRLFNKFTGLGLL